MAKFTLNQLADKLEAVTKKVRDFLDREGSIHARRGFGCSLGSPGGANPQ